MGYSVSISIRKKKAISRSQPSEDTLIRLLKDGTNLDVTAIKTILKHVQSGRWERIVPKHPDDVPTVFRYAQMLRDAGFEAEVAYHVGNGPLHYLVDGQGKVVDATNRKERLLPTPADVAEILADAQLVIIGFGMTAEWIPDDQKWAYWEQRIQPQYLKKNDGRNDYPLYSGSEWITQNGERFIVMWMSH